MMKYDNSNTATQKKKDFLVWGSDHVCCMFLGSLNPNPKLKLLHHVTICFK